MTAQPERLSAAEKRHVWHPFTQMRDWCASDPLVLVSGAGALVRDSDGREYIDGNSSIWTNLHGHNHPRINAAIHKQLEHVAHTSFLGATHPPAIELAEQLVKLYAPEHLTRVFYSDDGSTAIEVAIKMAAQYWQLRDKPERQRFVAFSNAYHGDTMGASSLSGIGLFHERFRNYHFPVDHVANATELEEIDAAEIAAVVIEPLIQGAAGMRLWPRGLLSEVRSWCDGNDVLLIADEVMTGFGRTGTMFACEQENVVPDFVALAKGLSGGYLPLAVTLTSEKIFEAFLGSYEERKTFFYGHSYTANQLGCAAALASLEIFRDENVLERLQKQIGCLTRLLASTGELTHVGEVRQCGFISGVELRRNGTEIFDWRLQMGAKVCAAARNYGLLTRPIGDVIVLMPPYCITNNQVEQAVSAINRAIIEICGE